MGSRRIMLRSERVPFDVFVHVKMHQARLILYRKVKLDQIWPATRQKQCNLT